MAKVIQFVYNGGSYPGKVRTVSVDPNGDGRLSIAGIDLESKEYRNFTRGKMSGLKELEAVVIVKKDFPNIYNGMANLAVNAGYNAVIDLRDTVVCYKKPAKKVVHTASAFKSLRLQYFGQFLDIEANSQGQLIVHRVGSGVNLLPADPSLDEFLDTIRKALS